MAFITNSTLNNNTGSPLLFQETLKPSLSNPGNPTYNKVNTSTTLNFVLKDEASNSNTSITPSKMAKSTPLDSDDSSPTSVAPNSVLNDGAPHNFNNSINPSGIVESSTLDSDDSSLTSVAPNSVLNDEAPHNLNTSINPPGVVESSTLDSEESVESSTTPALHQ